jgi:hypothetical protein
MERLTPKQADPVLNELWATAQHHVIKFAWLQRGYGLMDPLDMQDWQAGHFQSAIDRMHQASPAFHDMTAHRHLGGVPTVRVQFVDRSLVPEDAIYVDYLIEYFRRNNCLRGMEKVYMLDSKVGYAAGFTEARDAMIVDANVVLTNYTRTAIASRDVLRHDHPPDHQAIAQYLRVVKRLSPHLNERHRLRPTHRKDRSVWARTVGRAIFPQLTRPIIRTASVFD